MCMYILNILSSILFSGSNFTVVHPICRNIDLSCILIGSPVMLRKFDSGVMVIQNKSHSDEEVLL